MGACTLTLGVLFSSAAEPKTTSTNTIVIRNSIPKPLGKKSHISKRNFKQNQTWAAVRFGLIVVVPSPARPRTFIQNNLYYDIFLYAVLRTMLLAPTGALIVTMCYYIYVRPLFQIFSQSIDATDVTRVTL